MQEAVPLKFDKLWPLRAAGERPGEHSQELLPRSRKGRESSEHPGGGKKFTKRAEVDSGAGEKTIEQQRRQQQQQKIQQHFQAPQHEPPHPLPQPHHGEDVRRAGDADVQGRASVGGDGGSGGEAERGGGQGEGEEQGQGQDGLPVAVCAGVVLERRRRHNQQRRGGRGGEQEVRVPLQHGTVGG